MQRFGFFFVYKFTKHLITKKMKTLVAYFSASGVTERVAQEMAQIAHAELFAIVPQTLYSKADLDWMNPNSRSTVEMKDLSFRPPITGNLKDADTYEVIFVGFPIWWYTAPTIINTFLDTYNFANKVVIPFATSGGTTIAKPQEDLRKSYPNLNWKPGKLINRVNRQELEAWFKELGIL